MFNVGFDVRSEMASATQSAHHETSYSLTLVPNPHLHQKTDMVDFDRLYLTMRAFSMIEGMWTLTLLTPTVTFLASSLPDTGRCNVTCTFV